METKKQSLSGTELTILRLFTILGGEAYGQELVDKSDGLLKRKSIYVFLGRMEDKGFLEVSRMAQIDVTRGIQRKYYKITALGQEAHDQRINIGMNYVAAT